MLVLSRKVGERIIIDGKIVIEVVQVKGNRVRLGIEAPPHAPVLREELLHARKSDAQGRELAETS
jgi:carbon storage regulator